MSATVALAAIWLNAVANPSDGIAMISVTALVDEPTTNGTVNTYAGGRQRAIQPEGVARKYTLTTQLMTADQVQWIEAHVGQVCCLRDFTGLRRFVTYFSWSRAPYSFANRHDLTNFYLYETTASDQV